MHKQDPWFPIQRWPWMIPTCFSICAIFVSVAIYSAEYVVAQSEQNVSVRPIVETTPVPDLVGDADDPAIWIHPTHPDRSVVITSAKGKHDDPNIGGIFTYNLDGTELERLPVGYIGNVDVRYNFPLAEQSVDLVVASKEKPADPKGELKIFRVNPDTRRLVDITANTISVNLGAYGLCMYRSPHSGKYYAFVNEYGRNNSGRFQQFELKATTDGRVTAELVHQFSVGSEAEGCVADDVHGTLYIAETLWDQNNPGSRGIWKYSAEPPAGGLDAPRPRTLIASFASGHFGTEIEGVTIYYTSQHTGYIILVDQNGSKLVVYRREGNNEHVGSFRVSSNNDLNIDPATYSDGVDVTNAPLGDRFPRGMLVVHDERNTWDASDDVQKRDGKNFKFVRWDDIANAFSPPLSLDTTWNPRQSVSTPPPTNPPGCPYLTAQGTVVAPTADARVEEANPTTNYGEDASLRVDGGTDPDAESYLRFDVSSGRPVTRATLRVYSFSSSSQAPSLYTTSGNWTEAGLTWNARPPRSSTPIASAGAAQANCYIDYDVSATVRGSGSYAFVLATAITDGVRLSSREGSHPPQLIISDYERVMLPMIMR